VSCRLDDLVVLVFFFSSNTYTRVCLHFIYKLLMSTSSEIDKRLARLKSRFEDVFNMFENTLMVISQSSDDNVLVYDPIIDASANMLLRVEVYQIDLNILPLRPERVRGNAEKLFRMNIACTKPNAKMPRYELSLPIMPQRQIEVLVVKGEVKAKTHIGNAKCQIQRAYVNMEWINLFGKRLPKVHYIDLYGVTCKNESVKERMNGPSFVDYKKILDAD
jgi:hypothetical protein